MVMCHAAHSVITPHGLESPHVSRKGVRHLKKLAPVGRSAVSGEEVEERHVDLATLRYAGSAGWPVPLCTILATVFRVLWQTRWR